MRPYFDLDDITIKRIIDLRAKCEELGLENVCFIYDPKLKTEVKFYMVKYAEHWELTVIQNWEKKRDFYIVIGKSLTFEHSKND